MKKVLILFIIVLLIEPVRGQSQEDILSDTLFSVSNLMEVPLGIGLKNLPKFEVDPCLFDTLEKLVKNDKNCSDKIGYYFSVGEVNERLLIKISPVDLSRVRPANFFGYFFYCGRIFLCYGDIHQYLSKIETTDSLILKPYVSNSVTYNDLYLGGDTNGILKAINCNDKQQYVLIKTCRAESKKAKRRGN